MKKGGLWLALLMGAVGFAGYAKKELIQGVFDLEKPQADLFTRIEDGGNIAYLCKNLNKSEEMLKDWVEYNGWQEADRVGEGYFFLNDKEETLLMNREPVLAGRYLLWRASRSIEG